MYTKTVENRTPDKERYCQVLGVTFFNGSASGAVDCMSNRKGLLVAPAAPLLRALTSSREIRDALQNADFAITDSAYMVLIWRFIAGEKIQRVSGLAYLREFLRREEFKVDGSTFWVMAGSENAVRNTTWLRSQGLHLRPADTYIAPMYGPEIADLDLVAKLKELRPKHIILTIGGGTQERLGLYLKRNLDYQPAIHCLGAAIAFLSGDQVHIPEWADHLYLGWLFRCFYEPRRYVARYWAARMLLPLMLRYRRKMPSLET